MQKTFNKIASLENKITTNSIKNGSPSEPLKFNRWPNLFSIRKLLSLMLLDKTDLHVPKPDYISCQKLDEAIIKL